MMGKGTEVEERQPEPAPTIIWQIVDGCNYRCGYCFEKHFDPSINRQGSADEEIVENVLAFLSSRAEQWEVKFGIGESTLHPEFIDICGKIAEMGHTLSITTNFSATPERLGDLIDACGSKLRILCASLHLTQADKERFLEKAIWFQGAKQKDTRFLVTSVMTERSYPDLITVKERLAEAGVTMEFQTLRINGRFVEYPPHIQKEMTGELVKEEDSLREEDRERSFFGTYCHTGEKFLVIYPKGDVFRCFSVQPGGYLGNIRDGTFTPYPSKRPCLASSCSCTAMHNRHMVRYGERAPTSMVLGSTLKGLFTDGDFQARAVRRLKNGFSKSPGKRAPTPSRS